MLWHYRILEAHLALLVTPALAASQDAQIARIINIPILLILSIGILMKTALIYTTHRMKLIGTMEN
jgi:hypothetical protein